MAKFHLVVNGRNCSVDTDSSTALLTVLRDHLELTGAKPGCGEGQCGACTVLVDGKAVHSCITPVSAIGSHPICTIEGATPGSKLQHVQQAFLAHSAFQCGYCTPGMIMASVALLDKIAKPTSSQIRAELNGNLCRCGTYGRIVNAVLEAARALDHV